MFGSNKTAGDSYYKIARSLRFRSSATATLSRTPSVAGSRTTWTWSSWVKRGSLGSLQALFASNPGGSGDIIRFTAGDAIEMSSATAGANFVSTALFRDVSAWYHIVFVWNTGNATQADRIQMYVNGVRLSGTALTVALNATTTAINTTNGHVIGGQTSGSSQLDGYMADVNFIDGQALDASSFGETDTITGVWKPKKYSGTYGTNGFYLNFSDNSGATATTIGKDSSGNGNNWTPNNISVTAGSTYDSMIDVPTPYADGGNGRGNYAIINPFQAIAGTSGSTILEANLRIDTDGSCLGNWGMSSGKWYWEVTWIATAGAAPRIGVFNTNQATFSSSTWRGDSAASYLYIADGQKRNNNVSTAYGSSFGVNVVIGVALDMDAGTVTFYRNGVSQGVAFTNLSGLFFPEIGSVNSVAGIVANFGQRPYAYTPPSGFKALNTFNLPDPTIEKPNQYFDVTLYTGNGTSQSPTNSGFSPDFVWIKERSTADSHMLFDSVRGATNVLNTNNISAEATNANTLTAFNSSGFSVGTDTSVNANTSTYVAWQWDETPTAGFDIVTYTGNGANRTIAHSLGVAPSMMIIKGRTTTQQNWIVYHKNIGAGNIIRLNTTDAQVASSTCFNSTAPTSSVFSLGTELAVNSNGDTYVAYLFAEVEGYSKFGSYTGNGSTDGPFVYCGFRPKYVLIKRTDSSTFPWQVYDSQRDPINVAGRNLNPNDTIAEASGNLIDFISNGFKLRDGGTARNASGGTYIFMAFAENPFKYALAR